jgi:type II secretory pathway component PulL
VNIDFVEPRLPSRRAWIVASLPMVLALALWGTLIFLGARLDAQREQLAAAELAAKAKPFPPAVHLPPPPYQAQALAAIQRAELPEADALAELEHVEVAGIQLRSIDVNPAQEVIVVELDAANDEALGDYLDQLNSGDGPARWHIQKLAERTGQAQLSASAIEAGAQTIEGHTVFIARGL